MFHIFPSDLDPANGSKFKLKIWSPTANINVRFQLEKEGNQEQELNKAINEFGTQPFDFENDLLFRAAIINLGENKIILTLSMPHIITDGWSINILLNDMLSLIAHQRAGNALTHRWTCQSSSVALSAPSLASLPVSQCLKEALRQSH